MKVKTIIYSSLLVWGLGMAGCTQEEINNGERVDTALRISPYVEGRPEKGRLIEENGHLSFSQGDSLALVVMPEGGWPQQYESGYIQTASFDGTEWKADFESQFQYGVDAAWTPITALSWLSDDNSFDIYAYTPNVKQMVQWPMYYYTVHLDQREEKNFYGSDFMMGKTTSSRTGAPVSIPMKHGLSMLSVKLQGMEHVDWKVVTMSISAQPSYWVNLMYDEASAEYDEEKMLQAYKQDENLFSLILPPQYLTEKEILLSLDDGTKRIIKVTLEMQMGTSYVVTVDASDKKELEVVTVKPIPWDETVVIQGGEQVADKVYNTGDVIVYQHMRTENPVTMVVTGDGYTADDLLEGGLFERRAREALDFLFAVEPYKTYRNYFNVYIIPALSKEKGADNHSTGVEKDTYFDSGWQDDYSDMGANENTVSTFLETYCPDIVNGSVTVNDVPVCLLVNDSRYGGICWSWSSGKAYTIVPTTEGLWQYSSDEELGINIGDWRNTFLHEYGGHAFGRLADEYFSEGSGKTYYENYYSSHYWEYPMGLNVTADVNGETDVVYWKHMIGDPRFPKVDFYEGGATYELGIWRSEAISAMDDNRRYFNAISRQIIVENIMRKAKETFDFEEFCAKDVDFDELRDGRSRVSYPSMVNVRKAPRKNPSPILVD